MSIRDRLIRLLYLTGLSVLARHLLASRARFTLLFHGVSTYYHTALPAKVQPSLSIDELHNILSWLQSRFTFLTPQEFLTTDKPGVLLTFDDGLANNVTNVLPVLEVFGAPAIFFISTQHVTDPRDWLPAIRKIACSNWEDITDVPDDFAVDFYDGMSADQLAACAKHPLITIGSHTVSHPFLTQCTPETLTFELTESKRVLEKITGQTVDLFAYPTGDYNQPVAEAVRQAGYRAAFAVDSKNVDMPAFEIPRIGIYQSDPAYISLKLSGLYRRPVYGLHREYKFFLPVSLRNKISEKLLRRWIR
ncbi:MAG: polysaccharide deacetylase family protein [Chloroflexota bacterium]